MRYKDHEFDPVTPEELARKEQEEEFKRLVRREVRHMDRGEADEEIRADEEREAAEKAEREEAEQRMHKRQSNLFRQLLSGSILLNKRVLQHYPYLICIGVMFLISIGVMFMALHLDKQHMDLEREVQMLRERSVRLQEQRYRRTTHSAVVERLRERGIELYDPSSPREIIED